MLRARFAPMTARPVRPIWLCSDMCWSFPVRSIGTARTRVADGYAPGVPPASDRELRAAHRAVDDAVAILREARASSRGLERVAKQPKDFVTEVDVASEAA